MSVFSQGCCSGGAGSPIAGGAATGVLQENQMEISINYQYYSSNKFFAENRDTISLFNLSSDYLFCRIDYGLSKRLTLSVASGYFLDKSKIEKDNSDTISSNPILGYGDIIIFPRYSVYNKTVNFKRTAAVIGLGLKIPHPSATSKASYLTGPNPWDYYKTKPLSVQTTSGSTDFMFYSFFFREFQKRKLRIFMTTLQINKGYNPLGIKLGDYTSVGFFASKTFFYRWGLTTQIKAEKIGQIKAAKDVELLNYDIYSESTGSKKWFFIPQISYSKNGLTVFATSEIPLYQYLNGTQIGSQHQFTVGVNYRFLIKEYEDPLPSLN